MSLAIQTIRLPLPLHMGSVNCYLLETGSGFILIDTGGSNQRRQLEAALERAGCRTGDLRLIILTHGDFDHTGNAAYLRGRYATRIAMHAGDAGMAEDADMFFNRSKGNALFSAVIPIFFGFRKADRFTPDISLQDGADLADFGLEARVLSIPGHSKGSIGVLTASGDLFCGDLLTSSGQQPALNSIMDDPVTAAGSLEMLKRLPIQTVYPGHGDPFRLEQLKLESS